MSVPPEVEELIDGATVSAHVATSLDDRPHVAPVWYEYDDDVVRFTTGGKKLRNLEANPKVSLSIEHADGPEVHWNATLLGTARVIDDPEQVRQAGERIGKKYSGERDDGLSSDGGKGPGRDEAASDDDEEMADEAGRLVEVRIGSAVAHEY